MTGTTSDVPGGGRAGATPKARPGPKPGAARKPVSEARLKANRENARKSTGPRTPEGKARSRLNSLTHGLRAETPVVPGESAEALEHRVNAFLADTRPVGEVERALAEDAALASWRMARCRRVEAARITQLMRDAAKADDHVRALAVDALTDRLPDDPRRVARELRRTARGCRWVLGRFQWLREALEVRGWWETSERDLMLNLMGKTAHDAHRETLAHDLCHAYLTLGTGGKLDALSVGPLLGGIPPGMDPREFSQRVEVIALSVNASDPARARDDLLTLLQQETERLSGRERRLRAREAVDRAAAADRAACDTSREGQTLLRYESMHRRVFRNALRALRDEQDRRSALAPPPAQTTPFLKPEPAEPPPAVAEAVAPSEPNGAGTKIVNRSCFNTSDNHPAAPGRPEAPGRPRSSPLKPTRPPPR